MEKIELVEQVREKTGVSYGEAKEALDKNGDDLLEAIVWLEDQGLSPTRSARSSVGGPAASGLSSEMRAAQSSYERASETTRRAAVDVFGRARRAIAGFFRRNLRIKLVARRNGEVFLALPRLVVVVGLALWLLLDLLAVRNGPAIYYGLIGSLVMVATYLAPVVALFYVLFACRAERPADDPASEGGEGADA